MIRSAQQSQRLACNYARSQYNAISKRFTSSHSSPNQANKGTLKDEANLKWTEKEEAPKWLQKMAPTKGGTKLPTPKEAAVIAVVMAAGYYSWFVDPPKKAVSEGGS